MEGLAIVLLAFFGAARKVDVMISREPETITEFVSFICSELVESRDICAAGDFGYNPNGFSYLGFLQ